MEMMLRARILTVVLGVSAIANFGIMLYPVGVFGSKWLHSAFFVYASLGFFIFRWVIKVGQEDSARGDKYFMRSIFLYWGIPVVLAYVTMFMLPN